MIEIKDKKDCCGCGACMQRCPKKCISLEEDNEGFLYAKADASLCINCGLCDKVCPLLNPKEKIQPKEVLAVKSRNEEERLKSSSGGVFIALAREIIAKGGVVFGAVFDKNWEVHHVCAERIEDVYPMMGSKYVQSRIEDTFKEAESFLKQGREVLFTGSPCQIAGLRSFLRFKDYPNLLAVDFLCHGVPSPGVWRQYLAETYSGWKPAKDKKSRLQAAAGKNTVLLSLNKKSPIGGISFRDKSTGWKKYRFVVRGKSASKADQNSVLSSDIHYDNVYMRGFLSDIYLRPSCYECRCKNGANHSDLTIADYWGARVTDKDFDDDKGLGLVMVNTDKGKSYFDSLDMDVRKITLEKAHLCNGGFNEHTKPHPNRDKFFRMVDSGMDVSSAVEKCLHVSPLRRLALKVEGAARRFLRKCIKESSKRVFY